MSPAELLTRATLAFLGLLAVMALYRAIAGGTRWLGLLGDPGPAGAGGRRFRPARLQLLAVIAFAVLTYPGAAEAAAGRPGWLAVGLPLIVAASNLIYLWDDFRRLRLAGPA